MNINPVEQGARQLGKVLFHRLWLAGALAQCVPRKIRKGKDLTRHKSMNPRWKRQTRGGAGNGYLPVL